MSCIVLPEDLRLLGGPMSSEQPRCVCDIGWLNSFSARNLADWKIWPFHDTSTMTIWTPTFEQWLFTKKSIHHEQIEHRITEHFKNSTYSQLAKCCLNINLLNKSLFEQLVNWPTAKTAIWKFNNVPIGHWKFIIEQKVNWTTINSTFNISQLNNVRFTKICNFAIDNMFNWHFVQLMCCSMWLW